MDTYEHEQERQQITFAILKECDKIDEKHGPGVAMGVFEILNDNYPDFVAQYLRENS